ncbi:MAG: hypothetical protein FWH06_07900, partial [Oscillospiraceae bacterium]|nr:hypothetical protein [Oscillospiraceae bacterium]
GRIRVSVPVPAERREQTSGAAAFTRSAGSAAGTGAWMDIALVKRVIGRYGGSLLFSAPAAGHKASLSAAFPAAGAGGLGGLRSPLNMEINRTENDMTFLSEILDSSAFLPEWCL